MANIRNLKENNGDVFYPLTHERAVKDSNGVSLESKLAGLESKSYVEAWDGASTPVVANIPAGVTVTYNTTTYTGTLAASSSTIGKIYLVKNGSDYDRYITSQNGSSYSWAANGTTAMDLSGYATDAELGQLQNEVDGGDSAFSPIWSVQGKYIGNSGDTVSSSGWSISAPIELKAKESITIHTQGAGFSAIAKTNAGATSYTPLVKAPWDATGNNSYTYHAEKDIIIALCGKTGANDVYCTRGVYPLSEKVSDLMEESVDINNRVFINRFVGDNDDYVSTKIYGVLPGKKYRVYLKDQNWDMTGVTVTGAYRFSIASLYNDQSTTLIYVTIGSSVQPYYDITIPANCDYLVIGGRATKGTPVFFMVAYEEKINELDSRILNNYFIGNDNTRVAATQLFLRPGGRYRVCLFNPDWDMSGVTITDAYRLDIVNIYNGQRTSLISVPIRSSVQPYYDITVPDNSEAIEIGGRATLGTTVRFSVVESIGDVTPQSLVAFAFSSPYNESDINNKSHAFSALLNGGVCETFAFMTDPHLLGGSGVMNEYVFKQYIGLLLKYYNEAPVDWMICGGDWLNNGDTQVEACWKLGYMDATMRKLFKSYFPILGNHDTNYQGVVSSEDSSRGDLTHQTIVNLMFRENGNTYYKFKGNNTQFYVFDTGIDWGASMDSFKWEQIDWFANALLVDDAEHSVILQHIFYNSETNINPMAENIQAIAGAYNSRSSVTLNGITYNFAGCTGKIACAIAGHSHFDALVTDGVSIPVWLTTNMQDGNTPTFDLCIIDYTANKMKSVRVGTGLNREMNLA